MQIPKGKKVCNTCGGIGEIGYFQGESRFFITREECPVCIGRGFVEEEDDLCDQLPGNDSNPCAEDT